MVRPALLPALTAFLCASVQAEISFNREIRPILSEQCFSCHGFDAKHRKADLRLDTREGALAENEGVRAIVPGDLGKSELWKRLHSKDADEVMPPPEAHKPKLTTKQLATLRRWIEEGARYEPHWAFTAPVRPSVTEKGPAAVDALIDRGLREAGLTASPEVAPEKLLRRLSLDLTGLPPSPAELDAYLQARTKNPEAAYAAEVERLLAAPAYGERWGRWWLDQARYADSNGYSVDAPRSIWKFRDWVVNALNADLPFDRFTVEQLAGDLLPDAGESQRIATGFHRNTPLNQEGGIDVEQFRIDSVFDRVGTTGTVWLGLTVGCAQCHDHKFDPITQKEFYRMFAFFNNQDEPTVKVSDAARDEAGLAAAARDAEKALGAWLDQKAAALKQWETGPAKAASAKLSGSVKAALRKPAAKRSVTDRATLYAAGPGATDKEFKTLQKKAKDAADLRDGAPTTLVLKERDQTRKTHLLTAGDFTRPAEEVTPGALSVLHAFRPDQGPVNRLDLARWIVAKDNPLTARVIANRVWQAYFGRGIVETDNDFGSQGTPPSHPELLDWLAVELVERGWSLKSLHRTIVLTRAYRRDSAERADLTEKDPDNRLLARQTRIRLDAELVRDSALAASGLLTRKVGGPPVYPPIPEGVMSLGQVKRAWNTSKGEDRTRRGLYTFTYRVTPPPALAVFDAPDGLASCTRRNRSNTPLQALTLLNDPAFFEAAQAMAKVIEKEGLAAAFRRCTSRPPETSELRILSGLDPLSAARALLNLDETITRD
ncbi:MAG: PSD1 and planctomycete cytochrome C domain-containing protein [Opitutales bacterium]